MAFLHELKAYSYDTLEVCWQKTATPPYECLRMMISMLMTPKAEEEFAHRLLFIDITRAHPHCLMRRDLWVALPAEDPRSGEENLFSKKCKKVRKSQKTYFEHLFDTF
eukprot:4261942-Amphidinium_carterae.2